MFTTYYRLIYDVNKSPLITGLLITLSLSIPVAASLVHYNPIITIITFSICAALVASVLFFDVRTFLLTAYPAIHIIAIPKVISILTLFLLVSFIAGLMQSGRFHLRIPHVTLLTFIAFGVVTGFLSAMDKTDARLIAQYTFLVPIIVFIVVYNIKPNVRFIHLNLIILCVIGALVGWVSLALYLKTGTGRILFRWPSQNLGAGFLSLILPYSLISLVNSRNISNRVMWSLFFLGIGAGILITQTRAILFSSMLGILYLSWKNRNVIKVAMPALLLSIIVAPTLILSRMAILFGKGTMADWSAVGRVEIWLNSLEFVPKYFLFGMGIDNFHNFYKIDFPFAFLSASHSHNMFLYLLFELGLVGVIGYTLVIVSCFLRGHYAIKSSAGENLDESQSLLLSINAGVFSLVIAGMVDSYLRDPRTSIVFWSFLAYQLILSSRSRTALSGARSEP